MLNRFKDLKRSQEKNNQTSLRLQFVHRHFRDRLNADVVYGSIASIDEKYYLIEFVLLVHKEVHDVVMRALEMERLAL